LKRISKKGVRLLQIFLETNGDIIISFKKVFLKGVLKDHLSKVYKIVVL
jgi:hypothetical protein